MSSPSSSSSSSAALDLSVSAFLSCLSDAARRRLKSSVRNEAEKLREKKSLKYWNKIKQAVENQEVIQPVITLLHRQISLNSSQPPALIRSLSDQKPSNDLLT